MNELTFSKPDKIKAAAWLDSLIDSLDEGKTYVITVKEQRKKRSLSANAYAWTLIDKLTAYMSLPKEEIYRSYVKNIGGNMEHMRVEDRAVDTLCRVWNEKGIGWITETAPSGFEGWTDVFLYYGSSTYDTATMSRLIDLIVQDCKAFGIETLEDIELERLVEANGGG